ncbi:Uncharacterized protein Rs2_26645 [Raphanus sativus]|nr:Uncharacterized protein Rs2_26645 [Raphanus sativus]
MRNIKDDFNDFMNGPKFVSPNTEPEQFALILPRTPSLLSASAHGFFAPHSLHQSWFLTPYRAIIWNLYDNLYSYREAQNVFDEMSERERSLPKLMCVRVKKPLRCLVRYIGTRRMVKERMNINIGTHVTFSSG